MWDQTHDKPGLWCRNLQHCSKNPEEGERELPLISANSKHCTNHQLTLLIFCYKAESYKMNLIIQGGCGGLEKMYCLQIIRTNWLDEAWTALFMPDRHTPYWSSSGHNCTSLPAIGYECEVQPWQELDHKGAGVGWGYSWCSMAINAIKWL